MTRTEAAKILTVILDHCKDEEENYEGSGKIFLKKSFEALGMAIEALEQEPKWIPVSEKLPDTGEIVLVTENMWRENMIGIDWRNDEQWVRNGRYVTAWMPLPEPYEEV